MAWRGYARGPRPAITLGFLLLGAALLWRHLHGVDWAALRRVMADMPPGAVGAACAFTALSYAAYCSFDLLGRRATGHRLEIARVLGIGFVSHASALSLGPAGAGVRFRLAMRHGLPAHLTAALWLFNVASNWLGFVVVAGIAFAARAITWPADWGVGPGAMRWLGTALLAAAVAYVVACRVGRQLSWTLAGVEFKLPSPAIAMLQCLVSALNWLLIAGVVHALLRGQAPYADVLAGVLASALALAIIDVPAGLGVTETVFLTLLCPPVAPASVLAALVAYRAIYFLGPLLLAAAIYPALEWGARARPGAPDSESGTVAADGLSDRRARGVRCRPPAPAVPRPR
ncbi:MAG TPA: YbhN family protein [Albitalea sp.]|nr:YbhN family protein [Albitalea sp.]